MKTLKYILSIAAIVACITGAYGRRIPGDKVGVKFDTLVYDFGTVKSTDAPVGHEYKFNVTGADAVAILYATPSCGCTASDFPRKPTAAGDSAVIKVKFNPKGQRGEIDKDVRVRLKNGAGKSEQLSLRIRGVVVP